jgi:hypothetical protein
MRQKVRKVSYEWSQLVEIALPRFISLIVAMVTLGTFIKMPCDLIANQSIVHMFHVRLLSAQIVPLWCLLYFPLKKGLRVLFNSLNTTTPFVMWLERAIPFLFMQGAIYATVLHLKGDDAKHIACAVMAFIGISAIVEPLYKRWETYVALNVHVAWYALASYSIDFSALRGAYVKFITPFSQPLMQAAD